MGQLDEHNNGSENGNVDGNSNSHPINNGGGYKGKKPYVNRGAKINKKKEEGVQVLERRDKFLIDFFKLVGISVKLIGDENNPAIVYNDNCILNAYIQNFKLNFTDSPNQGNIIYTVKLSENPSFDKNRVMGCINDYEKRPVFKVSIKGSNPMLYLSGYHYLNREERLGRYPVFSSYNPMVFFTKEKTDEICEELNNDGYSLESI